MEAGGQAGPAYRPNGRSKHRSGPKMLAMRRINVRAVAPARQDAILGLAHIRDAHGKPYSDRHQGDGKSEGRDIGQHAMAKIVRLIPGTLIARQVIGLGTGGLPAQPACAGHPADPEGGPSCAAGIRAPDARLPT